MSSLNSSNVRILRLTLVILILFGTSCSPFITRIPTVADEKLARYVSAIGLEIVAVSEAHDKMGGLSISPRPVRPARYFRIEHRQPSDLHQLRIGPPGL